MSKHLKLLVIILLLIFFTGCQVLPQVDKMHLLQRKCVELMVMSVIGRNSLRSDMSEQQTRLRFSMNIEELIALSSKARQSSELEDEQTR